MVFAVIILHKYMILHLVYMGEQKVWDRGRCVGVTLRMTPCRGSIPGTMGSFQSRQAFAGWEP